MNVDSMYENFVKDTGLSDLVFKSVFNKIYDVLEKISKIKWNYITYTDQDLIEKYEFHKIRTIPLYIVEIIKNVFEDNFTLPKSVVIEISLSYDNKDYVITSTCQGSAIPVDLMFIKKNNIFDIFCCTKPVYDIFNEFDTIFKFSQEFSTPLEKVYPPLAKKFENTSIKTQRIENDSSESEIIENEQIIINLQNKLNEIFASSKKMKDERDDLSDKLNKIESGVSSRTDLLKRKEILTIDNRTLVDTAERQEERLESLGGILKDIDATITDINSFGGSDADLEYFLNKKEVFFAEKRSIEDTYKKTASFLENIKMELGSIKDVLNEIDDYNANDITKYSTRINDINKKQDELNDITLQIESEIKQRKILIDKYKLKLEKSQMDNPISIEKLETNNIKDHLYAPLQPKPVIAVINYMRYYYAYYVTLDSKELIDEYTKIDTYLIQTIVSRLVLAKYFGVYLNCIFSSLSFSDEKIEKVITVVKD